MRGDARARQAAIEEQVALNHMAAQMQIMAGAGKLGRLDEWLKHVRPQKRRTVRDMIIALQDVAARGGAITITKAEG